MANRTVDTDWNILSRQEWLAGWQDMLIPGTYERGIIGDLMLPGIACGIRKYLLIFNTDPQSPHDPIYVVDPRQFNTEPSTAIPIILGYNQSHYESLHPCTNADILASINLVTEYLENRYRFSKQDLPFLIGLDGYNSSDQGIGEASSSFSKRKFENNCEKKGNEKETEAPLQWKIPKHNFSNRAPQEQPPSPLKKSKHCQEPSQITENTSNMRRKIQKNINLNKHGETITLTLTLMKLMTFWIVKLKEETRYHVKLKKNLPGRNFVTN